MEYLLYSYPSDYLTTKQQHLDDLFVICKWNKVSLCVRVFAFRLVCVHCFLFIIFTTLNLSISLFHSTFFYSLSLRFLSPSLPLQVLTAVEQQMHLFHFIALQSIATYMIIWTSRFKSYCASFIERVLYFFPLYQKVNSSAKIRPFCQKVQ